MFVQNLVVLEAMKESGWRTLDLAGQKDRRPRYGVGFFLCEIAEKEIQRHIVRLVLSDKSLRPDIHVCIRKAMKTATTAGTQPPWANLATFAAKNPASMMSSGMTTASAAINRQRHICCITTRSRMAVTSISPVTAIP